MPVSAAWGEIKTVFLDMDGTLLDLSFDSYFWQRYLPLRYSQKNQMEFSHARELLQSYYKGKAGTLDWYCTDYWTNELDIDVAALKHEIAWRIRIFPHVEQFLGRLVAAEKQVALVTNAHPDSISVKMSCVPIESYFDQVISSHHFGCPKEQQGFWSKMMHSFPFDPESTLLIDDNLEVLAAAESYGIRHLITIRQPDSSKPTRDALPYEAISDFAEIMPA